MSVDPHSDDQTQQPASARLQHLVEKAGNLHADVAQVAQDFQQVVEAAANMYIQMLGFIRAPEEVDLYDLWKDMRRAARRASPLLRRFAEPYVTDGDEEILADDFNPF